MIMNMGASELFDWFFVCVPDFQNRPHLRDKMIDYGLSGMALICICQMDVKDVVQELESIGGGMFPRGCAFCIYTLVTGALNMKYLPRK